ncbi:MAG: 1-acyl-sn-glycerol-3-phosphate acyltransferase [Chitinophagales bacterium]|nr:MAG: 1-acyl-sn-glycerol-3-phosphate acyltransferase [Chitinophagales bacterium]
MTKNASGQPVWLKKVLISTAGVITYPLLHIINRLETKGAEHLRLLPDKNVLFVSNHHTYFMDVIALYHEVMKARSKKHVWFPAYLINPWGNFYFVAARETMESGFIPRILAYSGAVTVKRTWKEGNRLIQRPLDPADIQKIGLALTSGWVVTFPQGTTRPHAPGRIGTARVIKDFRPIVVPMVIDGFREAFDKTGLIPRKINVRLKIRFKKPLDIDYNEEAEIVLRQVMQAIEQNG